MTLHYRCDELEHFWDAWFGWIGREAGNPYRSFLRESVDFNRFIDDSHRSDRPCYVSVNPYRTRDQVHGLEKLYFDFDCEDDPSKAYQEALDFADTLVEHYLIKPLLVFSGRKGYHVYLWLWNTVTIEPGDERFMKAVYRRLQEKLLFGLIYSTLDSTSLGDIKRLARVPYTRHHTSGLLCHPVFPTQSHMNPSAIDLDVYRQHGIGEPFFTKVVKEVQQQVRSKPAKRSWTPREPLRGVRAPVQTLIDRACTGVQLGHLQRLAIACELIARDWRDEDIRDVFTSQDDYDEATTLYMIRHARRRQYRPFTTARLNRLVNE